MDLNKWMQEALAAGFTMGKRGNLEGSQANWMMLQAQEDQRREMQKMEEKNRVYDDWLKSPF